MIATYHDGYMIYIIYIIYCICMIYMLYVVRTSITTNGFFLKRIHYCFYIAVTKIIFANKKVPNCWKIWLRWSRCFVLYDTVTLCRANTNVIKCILCLYCETDQWWGSLRGQWDALSISQYPVETRYVLCVLFIGLFFSHRYLPGVIITLGR